MTKITPEIYLGDAHDADHGDLHESNVGAILNVAHDLQGKRGWSDGLIYAQCGLQDGPGNPIGVYHAAIMMLHAMVRAKRVTLVHDHDGCGQAVAVIVMYLHATRRMGWDHWVEHVRHEVDEPEKCLTPHVAHRDAFLRINWRLLSSVMEN